MRRVDQDISQYSLSKDNLKNVSGQMLAKITGLDYGGTKGYHFFFEAFCTGLWGRNAGTSGDQFRADDPLLFHLIAR